ncbi:MAG TPA: hypothetical protein VFR02_03750, partial [bacterium]|nr:hypothetical protein [bacterium]
RFDDSAALQSNEDPVKQHLEDLGLVAVQYLSYGGGVLYDHALDTDESKGAYQFFADRQSGAVTDIANAGHIYDLSETNTVEDVETLIVSYSTPLPLSAFQFLSAGFSLKYHYGSAYSRTFLDGSFIAGTGGTPTYTRTTSTSGLGLSTDMGFLAKLTDSLQLGVLMQNLTSAFNWTAQKQAYSLDSNGNESPSGPAQSVTISAPLPYAVKIGVLAEPPGSNILLNAQVDFTQAKTHWRVGVERFYPANNLVVRLGTFNDEVSGDQIWTFGAGFETTSFSLDGAFLTRSLPNLQDSIALGGALDAAIRF